MKLIDELRTEHDLIERVAGSLVTWATHGDRADGPRFLAFLRTYADRFHHAREEDVLFAALVRECELPADRGPIAALKGDHHRFAGLLTELATLAGSDDPAVRPRLIEVATTYAHGLWKHIDAENSVLLPESDDRLRRHGVLELPTRSPTEEEEAARVIGLSLVSTYPPASDHDAMRGDGCIMCPAYGVTCDGLEREWWSPVEWEDVLSRMAGE